MKQYEDSFWNVKAREEQQLKALRARLDQIERTVEMGRKAKALETSMGYQDFVKATESLKDGVVNQILGVNPSDPGSGHLLWQMKGKAQALNDVMALLTNATARIPALEAEGERIQNEIAEVTKRIPQPKEQAHE